MKYEDITDNPYHRSGYRISHRHRGHISARHLYNMGVDAVIALRVAYGSLCLKHHKPTYYDKNIQKLRCSVTHKLARDE